MTDMQRDTQGWTGRTVRTRDGAALGRLGEVYPAHGNGGTWGEVRTRFGRRHLVPLDGATPDGETGLQVPVHRNGLRGAPAAGRGAPDADTETSLRHHYTGHGVLADGRARQRERFGGAKVGAAFFGWLVAVGMSVLLAAIATGVGAAIGANTRLDPAGADAATVGLTGAVVVLVVLALAYFAGGYVAGRLARFDGTRNGILTWMVGVIVTILAALAAAAVGRNSDLAARVSLPAVPADLSTLTIGGLVAVAVLLVVTALAAAAGGRLGEQFHRRVDREADLAV